MKSAREMEFSGEFAEVVQYYSELRRLLYQKASQRFPPFSATPISFTDCVTADGWAALDISRRTDWSWRNEHHLYRKLFKRFDIAFKSSGKLAGLAYGVPTAHKSGLKIDLIEATPIRDDKHGRKVFELISYSAQVYAAMLGAEEIRIMKPTTASTRAYYESWGYDYVDNSEKPSRPDYCVMRLR